MFGGNILSFRLFGFDIAVHWSWLIIFVLFSWTWSSYLENIITTDFPNVYSNPTTVSWFASALLVVLVLVSVLIHELGHSIVARRLGFQVGKIIFFVLGGISYINMDKDAKATPLRTFLIAAVGPVVSLVLCVLFWIMAYVVGYGDITKVSVFIFLLLSQLAFINLILAIFNALPVYPLDGGRVLLSVLQFLGVNYRVAHSIVTGAGIIGSILMIVVGIFLGGIFLIFIGAFLFLVNMAERRMSG